MLLVHSSHYSVLSIAALKPTGPTTFVVPRYHHVSMVEPNNTVTDLSDFDGVEGNRLPEAYRLAEYLRDIVRCATSLPSARRLESAIRCRRRPGRRPCPGHVETFTDLGEGGEIRWKCTACGEGGVITGWKGSPYDLGSPADDPGLPPLAFPVDDEDHRLLRSILVVDPACERLVYGAVRQSDGSLLLTGSEEGVEELRGFVASEANQESDARRRRRLDLLGDKLAAARPDRSRTRSVTAPAAPRGVPALRLHRVSQPDDIFQVRVTLEGVEPPIWRRLLVPQEASLPRFHALLQTAMGWSDSHLHLFHVGDVTFGEPDPEFDSWPPPIDERRVTLNQLLPRRGSRLVYEYDLGDGWRHAVEVEAVLPIEDVTVPVPCCLEGARACPPEDSGGIAGYAELLQALRDPRHPEHNRYRQWSGDFDPEAFNLRAVNQALLAVAQRWSTSRSRSRPPTRR